MGAPARGRRGTGGRLDGLPPYRLRPAARLALIALRFVTLLLLVVFLMRPVARSTEADARDAVVAISSTPRGA